ncbi:microtubule-associated protein Jupiter isoform X11 [Phlebotomus papatasi]|uniref:microtubule-associated protein Jupiter isoform X11 n=1 Tax=Phlebotomus papatasi TaxID=29031 RepID=UPI002483E30A|nr:microtubule-associated protein Jupiter isoform X11 [Phlebotomus papatasi]
MTSTNFQIGFSENAKNSNNKWNQEIQQVLKPPGGGTSDIFGGESSMETPRSNKNRMASNIFGDTAGPVSKNGDRPRAVIDSHNRLFGEPERIQTPLKNRMKSNIPIGDTVDKGLNGHTNGHSGASSPKINGINGGCKNMENGVEHTNGTRVSSMSTRSGNSSASTKQLFGNDCCVMNGGFNRPKYTPRNPVTGLGLNEPMNRVRKLGSNRREGNPVTGEGYKPAGTEINTSIPCLNGANQVINKNRVPPGGFSSGLW